MGRPRISTHRATNLRKLRLDPYLLPLYLFQLELVEYDAGYFMDKVDIAAIDTSLSRR